MEPKIYRYVITADDGMAPCIDQGLLTLATCKPVIRRCAQIEDWVVAFFGVNDEVGELVWAGKVAKKLEIGEYQRRYSDRSDAVYKEVAPHKFEALRRDYHSDRAQQKRDFFNPALIFAQSSTWYFGRESREVPLSLQHLIPKGQGHRVNNRRKGDLDRLIAWLHSVHTPGIHGEPKHSWACGGCETLPSKTSCVSC